LRRKKQTENALIGIAARPFGAAQTEMQIFNIPEYGIHIDYVFPARIDA
jgi:hypothetical protein